jgi:hypothetical protein
MPKLRTSSGIVQLVRASASAREPKKALDKLFTTMRVQLEASMPPFAAIACQSLAV